MYSNSQTEDINAHTPGTSGGAWELATRLTLWYAGSAFALLCLATAYLYWALATSVDHEHDKFLADKLQEIRVLLRDPARNEASLRHEIVPVPGTRQYLPLYVRVLNDRMGTHFQTPGMDALIAGLEIPPSPDLEHSVLRRAENGLPLRILSHSAELGQDSNRPCVIQVALDRSQEEQVLGRYRKRLGLVLLVALGACMGGGHRIAQFGLAPLRQMAATAKEIGATTLHRRLKIEGQAAELAGLAGTFNEMLDGLEASFRQHSQFSADLAHELRTPLNNLRGEVEVALGRARTSDEYREVLSSCLEECQRLTGIIDSLLFLARAENPAAQISRAPFDLGDELRRIVEFYEASATEGKLTVTLDVPDRLEVRLDRVLLQRALGNLLSNAFAHTPPGGKITVRGAEQDQSILIAVADNGPGIAPQHLPRVFDRLYRVDPSRTSSSRGVGLGLSIVKSIAELHGGNAEIRSREGEGTTVVIKLRT